MKIGEAHRTVRCASLNVQDICLHTTSIVDVQVVSFLVSRVDRCANNFFFAFGPPLLLAQGTSVRQ
jgi:hypothetical protein